jgi:hypothetical protein
MLNSDPPLTVNSWFNYYYNEYDFEFLRLLGNVDANDQITTALNKIVDKAKSYEELKAELLTFIKERKDFVKDFTNKWLGDEPEKYELPRPKLPNG